MKNFQTIYNEAMFSLAPDLNQILEEIDIETKYIKHKLENQLITEEIFDIKKKIVDVLLKVIEGIKKAVNSGIEVLKAFIEKMYNNFIIKKKSLMFYLETSSNQTRFFHLL